MDNVPDNYQVVVKPSKDTVGSFVLLSILLLIAPVLIELAVFLDHPNAILKEEFITVGIEVIIFWHLFSRLPIRVRPMKWNASSMIFLLRKTNYLLT